MIMNQLIKATYRKDLSQMQKILDKGYDINTTDSDGRTALIHAVLDSDPDIEVIKFLIQNGSHINTQDPIQKWSALHFAARDNKKDIVSTLLNYNPDVDIVDIFGNTPLWRAVMSFKDDPTIISELLQSGADPSKVNTSGVSPCTLAETIGNPQLLSLLNDKQLK